MARTGLTRLLLLGAGALLLPWLAWPRPALAHAEAVRSEPPDACAPRGLPRLPPSDPRCAEGTVLEAPPAAVRVWFSEPIEPLGGGISVLGPSGRRVERGPARAEGSELAVELEAAESGTYLVRWRVVAGDTHPARGSFAFSVGQPSAPPGELGGAAGDVGGVSVLGLGLQASARWLHFVGYALGFGVLAFQLLILRPVVVEQGDAAERRLWGLIDLGVVALLLAEPLALLAQMSSLGAAELLDPEAIGEALGSSFGRVLAQRLAAATLLWVLVGVVKEAPPTRAVLALGLALAVVDGEAAHATGVRPAWLGLAINGLHVAAMGAWVGGLMALLAVWRLPSLAERRSELVARVGRPAAACLVMLALSGAAMALEHLTGPADLLRTAYGRTLTAKLAVLLAALSLALAAARTARERRAGWWRWEAAALLGVLALAGLLVSLPPPA